MRCIRGLAVGALIMCSVPSYGIEMRVAPRKAVYAGTPQIVSFSVGGMFAGEDDDRGPMLRLDPGINGLKLRVGYEYFGGAAFWVSGFHAWNSLGSAPELGSTYLGVEAEFWLLLATAYGGILWDVGPDGDTPATLLSVGIGISFP